MHVKQRREEGWHKANNPPEYLGQVGQTRLSKHNKNHNHSHFSRNNIEFRKKKKPHLGNKASGFNLAVFKASWLPCWTVWPVVGTCLVFRKCTNNIWADWRKVHNLKDGYCPESEPTVFPMVTPKITSFASFQPDWHVHMDHRQTGHGLPKSRCH